VWIAKKPDGSRRTARGIEDSFRLRRTARRAIDSAKLLGLPAQGLPVRRQFHSAVSFVFAHRIPMHRPFCRTDAPSSHSFCFDACMFQLSIAGGNNPPISPISLTRGASEYRVIIPDGHVSKFLCYGETAIEGTPHVDRIAAKIFVGRKTGSQTMGSTHILLRLVDQCPAAELWYLRISGSRFLCLAPSIPSASSGNQADRSAAVTSATPLISRSGQ